MNKKKLDMYKHEKEKARLYTVQSNIDLLDLSLTGVKKADELLARVYKEWKSGKIDDLTAHEIGNIFEAEPIHHLMQTSVYPLCDIFFYLEKGDLDTIEGWKR